MSGVYSLGTTSPEGAQTEQDEYLSQGRWLTAYPLVQHVSKPPRPHTIPVVHRFAARKGVLLDVTWMRPRVALKPGHCTLRATRGYRRKGKWKGYGCGCTTQMPAYYAVKA